MQIVFKNDTPELSQSRLESIEAEMDSLGIRDIYDAMLANGESPVMAQMLATQRAPATRGTDSEFLRRERDRMTSMPDKTRDGIVDVAKRAGIDTTGKVYNGQLGKYNDPSAWVSNTHDVRQVAMKKGLGVKGAVNVDLPDRPVKKTKIAPDILNRLERENRSADPSLDEKCRKSKTARSELRQRLADKHARKRRS